jgi:hypothetical protein
MISFSKVGLRHFHEKPTRILARCLHTKTKKVFKCFFLSYSIYTIFYANCKITNKDLLIKNTLNTIFFVYLTILEKVKDAKMKKSLKVFQKCREIGRQPNMHLTLKCKVDLHKEKYGILKQLITSPKLQHE